MQKRFFATVFGLLVVLLLGGCSSPGPTLQPFSYRPAPWAAGEVTQYDLLDRTGEKVGTAKWTWERSGNDWQQRYEIDVNGVPDTGAVVVSEALKPVRSSREVGGKRYETTYGAQSVEIKTTAAEGTVTTKTVPAAADAMDNDASLQLQRALPLAANYATRYTDIIPTTASAAPIVLSVTGAETITVPAGTFGAWRVKMEFGGSAHEAWYAEEPPYALLKYVNGASGANFVLTQSSVAGVGAPPPAGEQATASPSATPAPGVPSTASQSGMAPINWLLLAAIVLVQLPFLIGLPLLLGWYVKRRWGVGWGVFAMGMLSFAISQLIHVPLNAALGLIGLPLRGAALWPPLPLGLIVGLSAAVCEEGARLLVITVFARNIRGWRPGIQFGAGHGGAESIILGILVAVNLAGVLVSRGAASQALPPEALAQLQAAQGVFWNQSPWLPFVSVIERVSALALQVALSVLVVQSVTYRRPLYFVAALALHTVVDGWTIWARPWGIPAIEAGVVVAGLFGLWIIWRLREQPTGPAPVLTSGTSSGPVPSAADLSERQLSTEELARRAERSRYE